MTAMQAKLLDRPLLDCRHNLGECILWDDREQMLVWVDIHAGNIWRWTGQVEDAPVAYAAGERVGAIGLRGQGALVLALENGFALLDSFGGKPRPVADVEKDLPSTRLNDGRTDRQGRFVCGGMDEAARQQAISALYSLDGGGTVRRILGGIACANSICWSPDGRIMYFTDMPSRRIEAFDYDFEEGSLSNRRLFADLASEPGLADGSIVDAEGYLWNAQWGGGKIMRYAPDGAVADEIHLPVSNPTCLTFGGPELDTLYITTAWFGLSEGQRKEQPFAGGIFAFKPGVKGMVESRYGG